MIALRIGVLQVTLLPFWAKIGIFQSHFGSGGWLWGGFWCNSEMRCSSSTLRAPCRAVNYHLFEPLPAPLVFSIFNLFIFIFAPCRAVNYHLFEPLPAPLVFSIFNLFIFILAPCRAVNYHLF